MVLPNDLEDWLTDEGDRVVHKMAAGDTCSNADIAIYEIWLLDTETRNGGVAQYFGNRGREQWRSLSTVAESRGFTSLTKFIQCVDSVVADAPEPYDVIVNSDVDLDGHYHSLQTAIVAELRDSPVA